MTTFRKRVLKELKWRKDEIALLKKSTAMQGSTEAMRALLRRYMVPALYSLWEGFVYFIFNEYINVINKSKTKLIKVHENIVRHVICGNYELRQDTKDKEKQKKTLAAISLCLKMPIQVANIIPTASSVDYRQLLKILAAYGVEWNEISKYESTMGEFMKFRHGIAHGNMSFRDVDAERLKRFTIHISDFMSDLGDRLCECVENKDFRNKPFENVISSLETAS